MDDLARRHAYLVMTHRPVDELGPLLRLIDDERNDVYLHLDKRVGKIDVDRLRQMVTRSRVHLVPRRAVVWAHASQVDAELRLFRAAATNPRHAYSHYHLISGQDLPLRTADEIHAYFGSQPDVNLVGFAHDPRGDVPPEIRLRVDRYWLFQRLVARNRSSWLGRAQRLVVGVQHRFGVARTAGRAFRGMHLVKGANWVSLTDAAVQEILRNEGWVHKIARFSLAADEIYKQTILWNSALRSSLSWSRMPEHASGNGRLVDWTRGRPYTWRSGDIEALAASTELFARKFDPQVDAQIIEMVEAHVKSRARDGSGRSPEDAAPGASPDTEEHR